MARCLRNSLTRSVLAYSRNTSRARRSQPAMPTCPSRFSPRACAPNPAVSGVISQVHRQQANTYMPNGIPGIHRNTPSRIIGDIIISSRRRTATCPSWARGMRIEVIGGVTTGAISVLSNPITDTSPGTFTPSAVNRSTMPTAIRSL